MSYILESLKRQEKERKAAAEPELADLYRDLPSPEPRRRSKKLWLAASLLLNIVFLAGVALYFGPHASEPDPTGQSRTSFDRDADGVLPAEPERSAIGAGEKAKPLPNSIARSVTESTSVQTHPPAEAVSRITAPSSQPSTARARSGASGIPTAPGGSGSTSTHSATAILPRDSVDGEPLHASVSAGSGSKAEALSPVRPAVNGGIARPDQAPRQRSDPGPSEAAGKDDQGVEAVSEWAEIRVGMPRGNLDDAVLTSGRVGEPMALARPSDDSGIPEKDDSELMPEESSGIAAVAPSGQDPAALHPIGPSAPASTASRVAARFKDVPDFRQLSPELREQFGQLKLNVLVYYDDPGSCLAYINFRRYRTGDTLPDAGLRVEGIIADGVILNYGEGRFKLRTSK
ncbi:MAG: general secretion pathway protein GspB [Desulfobacterales bacterium]